MLILVQCSFNEFRDSAGRASKASLTALRRGLCVTVVERSWAGSLGLLYDTVISFDFSRPCKISASRLASIDDSRSAACSVYGIVVCKRIRCSFGGRSASLGSGDIPWARSKLSCCSNAVFAAFTRPFGTTRTRVARSCGPDP